MDAPPTPPPMTTARALVLKSSLGACLRGGRGRDRKSTRLNSSHVSISYAVFCLKKKKIEHLRPTADDVGKAFRIDDAEGRYIEFVKRSLPRDLYFQGLRVVVDCANGAAYKGSPK